MSAITPAVLAMAVLAAACASGGRSGAPPPPAGQAPASPVPPVPPAPVSVPAPPPSVPPPAPPAPVSAPAPSPSPGVTAIACPVQRKWPARLLEGAPFRVEWRECAAPSPLDVPRQQIVTWPPDGGGPAWALENARGGQRLLIEKADTVDLDGDGLQEVLVVMRHEGTGGYMEWCLAGRKGDGIGCWEVPDFASPAAKMLRPDEDFGFHGWQLSAQPRGLRLERSVYRKGVDPNCCPTRGSVVVRLAAAGGRLRVEGITRRPPRALAPGTAR